MVLASLLFILSVAGAFVQHEEEKQSAIALTRTTDWLLIQVQRETLRLQSAINLYSDKKDNPSKDHMLLVYDILLSRFSAALEGDESRNLRNSKVISLQLETSQKFFLEKEKTFYNLDASDVITIDILRQLTGDHEKIFNKLVQKALASSDDRPIVEFIKVRSKTSVYLIIMCLSGLLLIVLLRIEIKRSSHHAKMEHQARIEAISQERAKANFLSHMSHELRTPLNAIIGYSEMMEKEILGPLGNEKYRGYVKDITASGQYLLSLITDILNISKIEVENYQLHEEEVDLLALTDSCRLLCTSQAEKKKITLEIKGDFNHKVLVDPLLIKQIIINLTYNAIKFSPSNSTVTIGTDHISNQSIEIFIKDRGQELTPKAMASIFDPFDEQAPETTKEINAGLGLYICKRLIEIHGGTIEVFDNIDAGACFKITLGPNRKIS